MSAAAPQRRWLYGPLPDLLLGCGGAYALVLAVQAVAGASLEAWVPAGLIVLLASLPHYGATLLRVYPSAEERRRYAFFAIYVPALLAVLFGIALREPWLGSLILTVYLTWSPWHYTGQNYGVALMLLRRRGVEITPGAKRLVYASFILCYALTFLALHGRVSGEAYAPFAGQGSIYELVRLGIPSSVQLAGIVGFGVAYLAALGASVFALMRRNAARDLLPLGLMWATQALWFAVPVFVRHLGLAGGDSALTRVYTAYGFLWIAAAHAVQYLWVSSYYARAANPDEGIPRYYLKALLAGCAIWFLPALVFAPGYLGRLPYDAGLGVLIAAVVNLHHFILDGAIWKLRDGRVARLLLRPGPEPAPGEAPAASVAPAWAGHLLRPVLWTLGFAALALPLFYAYETEVELPRAARKRDVAAIERVGERLRWIGRDEPEFHVKLANVRAHLGDVSGAEREIQESLRLHPTPSAWKALAGLRERQGRLEEALEAYEQVLALVPHDAIALYRAAGIELALGRPERAEARLERAAELAPGNERILERLERARAADAGDAPAADPRSGS